MQISVDILVGSIHLVSGVVNRKTGKVAFGEVSQFKNERKISAGETQMKKFIPLLVAVVILSGCLSPKSYVDPSYSTANYQDIVPSLSSYRAEIIVEFQRDGEPFEGAIKEVKENVEGAFDATGVIIPDVEATTFTLTVVFNNIPESGAAGKGFATGLTFGIVGTLVTDFYEVSISYKEPSKLEITKHYKHALHTTIGNKEAPFEGVVGTSAAAGFLIIVDQVILNYVTDMQRDGYFL